MLRFRIVASLNGRVVRVSECPTRCHAKRIAREFIQAAACPQWAGDECDRVTVQPINRSARGHAWVRIGGVS